MAKQQSLPSENMKSTKSPESFLLAVFIFFLLLHIPQSSSSSPSIPKTALPTKSGYLPVDPSSNSAIFYTFYEAQIPNQPLSQTPLLIWLQGGPGCSSMIGNFLELGPWRVSSNSSHRQNVQHLEFKPNPGSWNRIFGLLFLDSPIGTGFSIAATENDIPRDQDSVAGHLYTAITGFIESDPLFKTRPVYVTGESYGGKYIPSIGYYILRRNLDLDLSKRVNLKGVAIGNGLTDPITQVATHADSAYFSGFINEGQKGKLEKAQLEAIKLVKMGNWSESTNARTGVLEMLQNMTGLATLYDFTRSAPYETSLVTKFLSGKEIKRALRANESIDFVDCSDVVGAKLHEDVMKSVKYKVEYLVREIRVLLYQGHLDLRDGVVSNEAWVKKMKWDGIGEYLNAERKIWRVNNGGEVGGYVQKWENLSNVVVLGAGHLVPTDKGVNSQAMIEDWVLEKGLFVDNGRELAKDLVSFEFSDNHLF